MFNHTKKDSKSIKDAIVGGVQQVVDPFKLGPANPDMNSTATPASDKQSVSPESSPELKSAKPSGNAFRYKGRMTPNVQGRKTRNVKDRSKPSGSSATKSTTESATKPDEDSPTPPPSRGSNPPIKPSMPPPSTDQEG